MLAPGARRRSPRCGAGRCEPLPGPRSNRLPPIRLVGAKKGVIRTRSGEPYKPSALRAYEQALRTKILPALGLLRLSAVTRSAVQDLVDRLVAEGLSPSTVRNAILPLRAIYRRAISRSGCPGQSDARRGAPGGASEARAGRPAC